MPLLGRRAGTYQTAKSSLLVTEAPSQPKEKLQTVQADQGWNSPWLCLQQESKTIAVKCIASEYSWDQEGIAWRNLIWWVKMWPLCLFTTRITTLSSAASNIIAPKRIMTIEQQIAAFRCRISSRTRQNGNPGRHTSQAGGFGSDGRKST